MNQSKFIEFAAQRGNFSKRLMRMAFDAISSSLVDILISGEEVMFRGFGKFTLEVRGARTAQDIHRGKLIILPPQYVIKFTPSKDVREKLTAMHVPESYEEEYDDKVARKGVTYGRPLQKGNSN